MVSCPKCGKEFKGQSLGSHVGNCEGAREALFWSKVDQSGGAEACWPFRRLDKLGYGRFDRKGPQTFAHRASWLFTNGEIPADMEIAHRCDNRACCNPAHLFLATHEENMKDCKAKGRQAKGTDSGRNTVGDDDVVVMRASFTGQKGDIARIAREWELPYSLVRAIIKNVTWRHLPLTEVMPSGDTESK